MYTHTRNHIPYRSRKAVSLVDHLEIAHFATLKGPQKSLPQTTQDKFPRYQNPPESEGAKKDIPIDIIVIEGQNIPTHSNTKQHTQLNHAVNNLWPGAVSLDLPQDPQVKRH